MEQILIYSAKLSPRLKYTFKLVFKNILRLNTQFTSDLEEFENSELCKLAYGPESVETGLYFCSSGLLFEKGVEDQSLEPFDFEGLKAIFPVYNKDSVLPFDIFSAIFYFVSRYEEYQPYRTDLHGRFTAHNSVAHKLGILEKPIVNIWAQKIKSLLLQSYPELSFTKVNYHFIPTYDIDSAYAYTQKGLVRSLGGFALDIKNFDWNDIADRLKVLILRKKDPFDTFSWQIDIQRKYKLKPIYFILFGRYGRYNKNINTRNKNFRNLIKMLSDYGKIGIHPSYDMVDDESLLPTEKKNLENALNKSIYRSRQHFLRLNLPSSYRQLINNDITQDYTMGYAALPGFRAGICTPYNFYDIDFEAETNFMIYPFAVMDGTLRDYMKLTPADAIAKIASLVKEVKKVNGTFISLWHNESLSNKKRWTGWLKVYEKLVEMAVE